jgi:CVNH domain
MRLKIPSLALLFGVTTVIADGGFASTCLFCTIVGGYVLQCDCFNRSGQLVSTSINLNQCLANDNGVLHVSTTDHLFRPLDSALT